MQTFIRVYCRWQHVQRDLRCCRSVSDWKSIVVRSLLTCTPPSLPPSCPTVSEKDLREFYAQTMTKWLYSSSNRKWWTSATQTDSISHYLYSMSEVQAVTEQQIKPSVKVQLWVHIFSLVVYAVGLAVRIVCLMQKQSNKMCSSCSVSDRSCSES